MMKIVLLMIGVVSAFSLLTACEAKPGRSTCGPPTTVPNYGAMGNLPKKMLAVVQPYGICLAPNGDFAVISILGKVTLFDKTGRRLSEWNNGPARLQFNCGCAFVDGFIYVANYKAKKIFKFTRRGRFIGTISLPRKKFYRIAACDGLLYVTIRNNPEVYIFRNDVAIRRFKTAGNARGVAIGRDAVYVSSVPKGSRFSKVELFDFYGRRKYGTITFPHVSSIDGIAVDRKNNLIVASTVPSQVQVYSNRGFGTLIKTIRGIRIPVGHPRDSLIFDVAIGRDGTLLVADLTRDYVFMY